MSSLAKQLKELQIPGVLSATARAKASKRASLLFDPKEAAGIDTETIYSLGLNGLEGLNVVDHSFSAFERSLFSESSISLERTVQSKEANEKLDKQISKFLQYLSPYILLKPAHKALEWLIRRFQIHVFNADDLLACVLPYHETNFFARVLQLLSIGDTTSKWRWLHPVRKAGVPLSKTALLQHCISDFSFLALICDMVSRMLQSDIPFSSYRVLVTFYTSTIVGSLELMGSVSEKFLSFLLPHILEGLKSGAADLVASSYMIIAQLCSKSNMKEDLVKSLLDNICKNLNSGLVAEGLCCLTCICQLQSVKKLSKRSFKALVNVPRLVKTASQLSSSHDITPLLRVFLLQLISSGLKDCVTDGHSAPATVDTLLATAYSFVQEIDLDKDLVILIGRTLILEYCSARDKLGTNEKALQDLNANVKDLIQLLEKRYPVELEEAIGEHLRSLKASEEMGHDSTTSTQDQASIWTMDLVSLALTGVKSQVIVDSNTTLVLSLHHPRPEVRQMAVKRLGQLLDRKEHLSEDAHFVGESLLNRLQDEDPMVVTSVLRLEQVLVKNVSGSQLVEQLIKLLSKRSPQWDEIREKSSILLTSNWVTCAVPSLTDQVVFGLLPFLFMHRLSYEMVLSLSVTVSNSALEAKHPLLSGMKNVMKTKEWKSCAETPSSSVLAAANNVFINWLGGNLVAMEEKSQLQLVHHMTQHAKGLPEDSLFHLLLHCMLERAIAKASEKCKLALCNAFVELVLPDIWKITKLQGSYMNELTEGTDSESVPVDAIPEPLLTSLVRLLSKQSIQRIAHARAAITLWMCKNVLRNMPAVGSASSGEWWSAGKPDSPENTYTKLLLWLLEVLAFGSSSSTSCQVAFKELFRDLLEFHLENKIALLKFLAYVWSAQICKVHDQNNSPRVSALLQVQCLHIANVCFTSLSGKIVKQLITSTCAVIPSLLVPLCSPISAVRRSAVSCIKNLGTQFTTVQCCPITTLMSVLKECTEELAADPGHLQRVFTGYFAPLMPSHKLLLKSPTQTKTVKETLAFILGYIVSDTTPTQVRRILLSSLSGFVTQDMLKTLMPLLSDLLDQCGGVGSDFSEDHSIILQLIVKKFTPETAPLFQSGSQPWKVLLRLLAMRKAVYHGHPSPIRVFLEQISNRFFQAIPTEEQQQHLLKFLLDVLLETKDFLIGNSIKDTIMKLSLTADLVTEELLHLKTRHDSEPKKKKLKKAHPASDHDQEIHHHRQRSTVVLELLQRKINIVEQHRLIPALFAVLRRCTEVDHSQSSSDYIMQLTFSVINSICQKLSTGRTPVSSDHLPENQFDVELIVQCIRSSESPQTHNQALLLLATAAKLFPEKVLHNVMSIFSFMGASILRQDDSYSFQVITKTLDTVIPALIQAGENQQLPQQRSKNPVSVADVVSMLIRVFVDASPHIPEHRQLPLFTHLVNTVGSRQFLHITLILLLERHVVHGSALSQVKEALTAPSSPLGTDFCLRLLHSFYPDVQVESILKLLQYVDGLPLEKPEGRYKPRMGRKTSSNFLLVTPLFDVDTHSAKHLRQFKYVSLSLVPSHLGSAGFFNKVHDQENTLNSLFMRLLEETLNFVTKTAQHAENVAQDTSGKFWKALLHRAYDIIDKVNLLLKPSVFFGVIHKLVQSNNPTVRRKAMELLNSKLSQGAGNYGENQVDALLALVTELLVIARGTEESDESMVNRQTALYSLKLLSRQLANKHPNQFKEVLSEAIKVFSFKDANTQVASSAVLCVAEAVSVLQAHAIPFLPKLVPSVLNLLRKTGKDRSGLLALCSITALLKTTEALPHFLSPYLVDILVQVTNPSIAGGADLEGHGEQGVVTKQSSVQAQLRDRLESLRKEISTKISPRVLITAVSHCYDELIDKQKESVSILMCLLADCVNGMSKEDVKFYQSQLFNLFLVALDFRSRFNDEEHDDLVETTEGSVIEAFLSLVVKLSEATFRPMFLRVLDWATGNSDSKDRLLVFYRLCDSVAGKLKSLFVLFAGYIVKNCTSLLNATNSSKTEESLFPDVSKERGMKKSCILLSYLLDCLHKCVLYDSHGFLDSDRFQCLMQPLVDQIDNPLGGEETFRERLSDHLVPCLSQFAAASGNDAHWKPLNYQVLLKTRHSSALVRFAALRVLEGLHSRLGEDFVVLLPETIPFLAELMEDECFEVEQQCQHVISEIEQVLGESLQKYF